MNLTCKHNSDVTSFLAIVISLCIPFERVRTGRMTRKIPPPSLSLQMAVKSLPEGEKIMTHRCIQLVHSHRHDGIQKCACCRRHGNDLVVNILF